MPIAIEEFHKNIFLENMGTHLLASQIKLFGP